MILKKIAKYGREMKNLLFRIVDVMTIELFLAFVLIAQFHIHRDEVLLTWAMVLIATHKISCEIKKGVKCNGA